MGGGVGHPGPGLRSRNPHPFRVTKEGRESCCRMFMAITRHGSSFLCCFRLFQVSLNDSHNQMVVHWAGERSDVIVALARDSLALARPKSSDVSIVSLRALPCTPAGPSAIPQGCHSEK